MSRTSRVTSEEGAYLLSDLSEDDAGAEVSEDAELAIVEAAEESV